jgi:predicted enzyme related to lactoylglutathione lyase
LTQRHHLKDLVRARMARTGESYSTARAQLARGAKTELRGSPKMIVPVTDIERSAQFYAAALGLPVRLASPTWTILGDDGATIALEPAPDAGVDLGIGIKVADLQATLEAVAAAGGRIDSYGDRVARVADPDGNIVRLMAVGVPRP